MRLANLNIRVEAGLLVKAMEFPSARCNCVCIVTTVNGVLRADFHGIVAQENANNNIQF